MSVDKIPKRKFCITAKIEIESLEIEENFGLNGESEEKIRAVWAQLDKSKLIERFKENIKFGDLTITKILDISDDPQQEGYNLLDWHDFKWEFVKSKNGSDFFKDISG